MPHRLPACRAPWSQLSSPGIAGLFGYDLRQRQDGGVPCGDQGLLRGALHISGVIAQEPGKQDQGGVAVPRQDLDRHPPNRGVRAQQGKAQLRTRLEGERPHLLQEHVEPRPLFRRAVTAEQQAELPHLIGRKRRELRQRLLEVSTGQLCRGTSGFSFRETLPGPTGSGKEAGTKSEPLREPGTLLSSSSACSSVSPPPSRPKAVNRPRPLSEPYVTTSRHAAQALRKASVRRKRPGALRSLRMSRSYNQR